jgi:hypothetical protein
MLVLATALLVLTSATPATPGSRASIDATLDRLYPNEKDYRFGLQAGPGETEPPLAEVVVYRVAKPVPHWHYVTYGLSELGEKSSTDAKLSGFGLEYTLRLVDPSPTPPAWPINLLRWVAAQVWLTRQPYDPSHSMNFANPRMLETVSPGVEGLAFLADESLGTIDTPNGTVQFVNVVPLARGEFELIGRWDVKKLFAEIRALQKDLLWRPGRKSCLDGPRAAAIAALVEKDGSSQSVEFVDLACDAHALSPDGTSRSVVSRALRYRLAYGREVRVLGSKTETKLSAGPWAFKFDKSVCELHVPPEQARALADEVDRTKGDAVISRPGGVVLRLRK